MNALPRSLPWLGLVGVAAISLAALAACGSPPLANEEDIIKQPDGSSGSGGGSGAGGMGGSAGSGGATPFACTAEESIFYGAPVDATNACLDTGALVAIGCGIAGQGFGELCVKRRSDGARYWSMLDGVPRYDVSVWESCTNGLGAPEPRPALCATRTCAVPAPGFCSTNALTEAFSCGSPISEWDESCCQRPKCETVDDCGPDQDCRSVSVTFRQCWPRSETDSCGCNEIAAATQELRCIPTPGG